MRSMIYYDARDAFAQAYDETIKAALDRLSGGRADLWARAFELDYGMDVWQEANKANEVR